MKARTQSDLAERTESEVRRGLVCKAHRLVYHSTLGLSVKKKKKVRRRAHLFRARAKSALARLRC